MLSAPEATTLDYRIVEPDDIEALYELYVQFFRESGLERLGLSLDGDKARRTLHRWIETDNPTQLIALDNAVLVGVLGWFIDRSVTVQPYAVLDKFFVRPDWRRSKVGSTLLALALDIARSEGCILFRAVPNAGLPGAAAVFIDAGFSEIPHSASLMMRL